MIAAPPSRRFLAVVAVLLALAAVALFGRALFLGHTFAERDLAAFYYPAKWLLAPLAEAAGGIPQWNPFFGSGQPFASNPEHALFHPMTALFFLLPFEWAFRLQVILPPLLAVPCMIWFLRVLRRSRPAALLGGLAWGLGGFTLSATCLLPELLSAVPLPLTLGFAVLVFRRPSAGRVVGLAFSLALQLLAGEPGTLLAVPPLLVAALAAEPRSRWRAGIPWLGLGLGLAAAIAAASLLPGLHHASRTIRAAGLTDAMANEWSMPAIRLFELLTPNLLGHVDRDNLDRYWGRAYYGAKTFAFYYSLYPGLLVSLLAFRAWVTRRRVLWLWGGAALLGYLLAQGDRFVFWPVLRQLPGFSAFRYPEKLALLFVFPTLVVGSYGFDWFVLGRRRLGRFLAGALGAVAAVGLALALALPRVGGGLGLLSIDDMVNAGWRLAGVALVLGMALYLSRTWARGRRGLLLGGVLAADLVVAGRALVPTVPVERLATPPAFLKPLLQPGRDDLVFHMAEWDPRHSEIGGLAKPPALARWGLPMTLERDVDFTQLRWTFESTRAWMELASQAQHLIEPLLERRGVTAIIRFGPGVRWEGHRLVRPDGGPLVEVLLGSRANRLAFAAERVEIVRGVAGWRDRVRGLGGDVVRTACVEDDQLSEFLNPPGPAEVRLRRESSEAITMEVDAKGPNTSFIAINQTWDANWRVTLDGSPARLLRTDLALSGIVVPPGRHHLRLAYRDAWLTAGLAVSGLTTSSALLWLLLARRRSRRGLTDA